MSGEDAENFQLRLFQVLFRLLKIFFSIIELLKILVCYNKQLLCRNPTCCSNRISKASFSCSADLQQVDLIVYQIACCKRLLNFKTIPYRISVLVRSAPQAVGHVLQRLCL